MEHSKFSHKKWVIINNPLFVIVINNFLMTQSTYQFRYYYWLFDIIFFHLFNPNPLLEWILQDDFI